MKLSAESLIFCFTPGKGVWTASTAGLDTLE